MIFPILSQNPVRNEYKAVNTESVDNDYGTNKYKNIRNGQSSLRYQDSYEDRLKLKDNSKQLYDSIPDNKPEYDYDSDTEDEEEEEDNKKSEEIYYSTKNSNNKNGYNSKNYRKNLRNPLIARPFLSKPDIIPQYYRNNKKDSQTLPLYVPEPMDNWAQYFYSNQQLNGWPRMPLTETFDSNLFNLMNGWNKSPNKESVKNSLYAPAFDLMSDSLLKSASNPIPLKTMQNSKIYGPAAKYQSAYPPLNLFAGYGRDYSLADLSDLYPGQLVGQTPLKKNNNPLKEFESTAEYNSGIRDSIKV